MIREQLKKKVKEITKEKRKWDRRDIGYHSAIMFDRADCDVWLDVFINVGDFKRYHSETIEQVPFMDIIYQNTGNQPMTVDEIDEAIVEHILSRCGAQGE